MQTIGSRLVLGFEFLNFVFSHTKLIFYRVNNQPSREGMFFSYAARYSFKRHSFYAIYQARTKEASLAYMQRVRIHLC